jgi:hypothetical protein
LRAVQFVSLIAPNALVTSEPESTELETRNPELETHDHETLFVRLRRQWAKTKLKKHLTCAAEESSQSHLYPSHDRQGVDNNKNID